MTKKKKKIAKNNTKGNLSFYFLFKKNRLKIITLKTRIDLETKENDKFYFTRTAVEYYYEYMFLLVNSEKIN